MNQAEPPLIANGMIFAYGSGENTSQAFPDVGLDFRMERRVPLSTHAVLYALDAQDRQGAVVERRSDRDLESLERARAGQRTASTSTPTTADLLLRPEEMRPACSAAAVACRRGPGSRLRDRRETNWNRSSTRIAALLMDWGGLTRYGSENAELRLQARRATASSSWATRSPKTGARARRNSFPASRI